jgi:hypothetical protein
VKALMVDEGEPNGLHNCAKDSVTRNAAEP